MSNSFNSFTIVDINRNWEIRIECFRLDYPVNYNSKNKRASNIYLVTTKFGYLWGA